MLRKRAVCFDLSSRALFTFREPRKGLQTLLGSGDLADASERHSYLAG